MFGTSGIRGIFGKDVTSELALQVGMALASEGKVGETIVIARDTRKSGTVLEYAVAAGANSCGANVLRAGIIPTPTLALAVKRHNARGVMITASHNPPEYNGLKIFDKGLEASKKLEGEIARRIEKKEFRIVDWKSVGKDKLVHGAVEEHIDLCLKNCDVKLIARKKPKVVIDCGDGAGSAITPELLRRAGCQVIEINCKLNGEFGRGLEPNAENLKELMKRVIAEKADLGIAHDGDADRAIAVDEKGELVGLDAQLALICEKVLTGKKGTIVTTVEASLGVLEFIRKFGGKPFVTRVGSLYVADEVKKKDAVFGGEPCGEYVFPESALVADGVLTALKLVELFCSAGSLNAAKKRVPIYEMRREKIRCGEKGKTMEKIGKEFENVFAGAKISREDGLRADFEDAWVLVRASGTEPIIRITCEGKSEKRLTEVYEKAKNLVSKNIQ
ncbi:putative phosphoglucosamine mutase [Candidatus Gugararchaeum adminiculabundum]|nr:putative phosphoglucosamine mutase [Candidatus Gugararchaeum adminiculabundum]